MEFQILDNNRLQFFNSGGDLTGELFISSSADMYLRPLSASGDLILGNDEVAGTVEIGNDNIQSTVKLLGGGTLTANGNTLNIGTTSPLDTVNLYNVTFSQSLFLTGSASITGSVTADNFIGSVLDINSSASFTGLPTSEPTITGSLWISGSSAAHPNSGYLMVFNP